MKARACIAQVLVWFTLTEPCINVPDGSFNLTSEEQQAGSYLPISSTWLRDYSVAYGVAKVVSILERTKHPVFIPHQSALDLANGQSKFDVTIRPDITTHHDELHQSLVSIIQSELQVGSAVNYTVSGSAFQGSTVLTPGVSFVGNMNFPSGSVMNIPTAQSLVVKSSSAFQNGSVLNLNGTLVVKSPSVVSFAAGSTLNVSGYSTIEVQTGAKLILMGNINTSSGTILVIKGGGTIEIANSQTISSGQTWYMNDTIFKFAPSMSLTVNGTLLATNATLTAQSGTWRGVTMNYGSSAVFDNSKILNAGGCWGCAALSVNSASVTLNNSEIDVPSGGAVSGLYANAYGGSNSVSINNSKIKSASDIAVKAYGLPVGVANSQIVQANGTTALYTTNTTTTLGNDKLKGGKLSAGYNGAILGGLYSGYGSHNHFCDAASSSLEAFSGGYIYANNNYWNNTPTMSGSPIYYNGSMGAPNCTGVSTIQSTASEITRSVQNIRAQALGVGDKTPEASLESALSKRGAGKIEEALAELRLVVNSGKMPDAQIALTQIGQIAVQYQKGPEQRGFVHEKLKKSDPLYLTALETSALLDATEGRTDDAIGTLKALANADKGTKGFYAQLNMAQLYRQLGNINKAKASLSSAKPQDERQTTDLEMLLASLGESNTAHSLNQEIQELTDNVFASQNNEAIQITAYPNPFNPSTTFSYSLPAEADVRLTIYDVTGREVSVLVNQKQGKGIYQAIWHATSFASGTYFYKMMIGDKNLSGKIVLLK